ncbi:unnamed protein product [Durusdinium trenchii]|uniref:Uncharacterized protein n=1 Tax=Durusdinium trenchii TaxID=1381693 RepID=A0ABP0MHP4_9DINO
MLKHALGEKKHLQLFVTSTTTTTYSTSSSVSSSVTSTTSTQSRTVHCRCTTPHLN